MTPEQIKQLAKQAGGTPYTNRHYPEKLAVAFSGEALVEFVRLVREDAFGEAASIALDYPKYGEAAAEEIRSLK